MTEMGITKPQKPLVDTRALSETSHCSRSLFIHHYPVYPQKYKEKPDVAQAPAPSTHLTGTQLTILANDGVVEQGHGRLGRFGR
jgi:hypothetical protein